MRQAIADLMTRANRDIPHYYLSTTIDMAPAMDWLHAHNRRSPVAERILPAALLLKAAALAAREVPELNGFWTDDHFTAGGGVHLGVAVSLRGGGLVAPALHEADALELPQLMTGRIVDRPCAVDGLLGVRPVVTATLSADHRATDGAVGAHYLTAVDHLLQNPEQL